MKANDARIRAALDRPTSDIRLYLLHGPDEAGALALAGRLGLALGPDAERIDLDGAALKSDPARLADEAAALSLFGGPRYVRVTTAGEESLPAVTALLEAEQAGNPVVMIAPALRATAKLVKLVQAADNALAFACYVPEGNALDAIAAALARDHGMRATPGAAHRLAQACGGDRAVLAREVEKLALYLDAAPERPQPLDEAALNAVGADLSDAELSDVIDAFIEGRAPDLGEALRRLDEAGTSAIPWLRQLARRLATLAEMRADIAGGEDVREVMKRRGIFFRDTDATAAALRRWSPPMLAAALARVRAVERAVMSGASAGDVIAAQEMLALVRR